MAEINSLRPSMSKFQNIALFLLLWYVFRLIKEMGYWEGWDAKTQSNALTNFKAVESDERNGGNPANQERPDEQSIHESPPI